ncbi:MAG: molybdopterin converting factor subunit 1 [Proteobacteria bacterium]|nr:molybdopterin converting factor subunit 1 [Pseudomonadota bacterium]
MQLLYFAWVRERIGTGEETLSLPGEVTTVGQLLDWLAARGEQYAAALDQRSHIRVAVNQTYVGTDHPVSDGDEVAIFPPVTGG